MGVVSVVDLVGVRIFRNILTLAVLELHDVTYGQTDGQTDRQTYALS